MNKVDKKFRSSTGWLVCLMMGLSFLIASGNVSAAPKPKLQVSKAGWSAKKNQLMIKGAVKQGALAAPITIYDLNGRRLAEATASK